MLSSTFRCTRPVARLLCISRSVTKKSDEKDVSQDDENKKAKKKLFSILSDVKEGKAQSAGEKLNFAAPLVSPDDRSSKDKEPVLNVPLDERVTLNTEGESAEKVVSKDSEIVYSELTKKLWIIADQTKPLDTIIQESMKNLLTGAVIEKKDRFKQDHFITSVDKMHHPGQQRLKLVSELDLFSSDPLNIFTVTDTAVDNMQETKLSTWKRLEEKELKESIYFAPTDPFEEMIMLTEQGCHWKFPINNEIDMPNEENEGFHRHVFLEEHLQGFPGKGPIRHFMELVVAGLSKNPYITVERKIENIEWFRNYFEEKRDILEECGVLKN